MDRLTALRRTIGTAAASRRRVSYGEHLVTVAMATWLMIGLFVDGWAHNNLDTSLESFFTPWHALFYSGFAACAGWLLWLVWRGRRQGLPGASAVPQGYGLGLVGLAVFAVGGAGDMSWHLVFGIERDIDALFSPTHLLLFAGIALIVTSPFRDAWSAPDPPAPSLRAFLPALVSLTLVVSLVAFFFMYWSPYTTWAPTRNAAAYIAGAPPDYQDSLRYSLTTDGVASALTTTLLLVGPLLLIVRRWRPPAGTATVLITVPALLSSALQGFAQPLLVLAALVAGLLTDRPGPPAAAGTGPTRGGAAGRRALTDGAVLRLVRRAERHDGGLVPAGDLGGHHRLDRAGRARPVPARAAHASSRPGAGVGRARADGGRRTGSGAPGGG
jgi:hypothetical protein